MQEQENRFEFDGEGGELFGIYISNLLLSIVTLGIYSFWGRVRMQKFIYQHTSLLKERFDYHATGKELFVGFLKGAGIVFAAILAFMLIQYVLVMIAGEWGGYLSILLLIAALLAVTPYLIVNSQRFALSRSSWRNIRFSFTGMPQDLMVDFIKGYLLTVITLGIYAPWFMVSMRRFFTNNSKYGDENFQFEGDGGELFGIYIKGFLLTIVTLGIYVYWLSADLTRYFAAHSSVQGKKFKSDITGGQIFGTMIVSMLMIIFSLGFATPWAIVKIMKLNTSTTMLVGTPDLSKITASPDGGASALADGIGDAASAIGSFGG